MIESNDSILLRVLLISAIFFLGGTLPGCGTMQLYSGTQPKSETALIKGSKTYLLSADKDKATILSVDNYKLDWPTHAVRVLPGVHDVELMYGQRSVFYDGPVQRAFFTAEAGHTYEARGRRRGVDFFGKGGKYYFYIVDLQTGEVIWGEQPP